MGAARMLDVTKSTMELARYPAHTSRGWGSRFSAPARDSAAPKAFSALVTDSRSRTAVNRSAGAMSAAGRMVWLGENRLPPADLLPWRGLMGTGPHRAAQSHAH